MLADFSALAQTCCSGGVPIGGSFGLGTAEDKTLQLLFTYDYNALKDLVAFKEELPDDTRERSTHSFILEGNYGLSSRWSISVLAPYIRQERVIQSFNNQDITITNGIGDPVVLLKYRILKSENTKNWEWIVGAGPKMPLGKTTHRNLNNVTLVADMQSGSGSWDVFFWSYSQISNFITQNLSLISVTTYRHNGSNKEYNETQKYKFGNEFQVNLGANYRFFSQWPIDIFTSLRYRNQQEDLIDNNIFPSSGGRWLYIIPGLNINFNPDFFLRLSSDLPLIRDLFGTQLTTSYKLTFSLQYSFPNPSDNLQNSGL